MPSPYETFRPSGRFGPLALPYALVAAAALGGLAWVYQWLLDVIPFVYLNFLITLGMALAISVAVGGVVRLGRVRGRGGAIVLGVVVGLATVLASHWWAYHLMLGDTDIGDLTTRLGFADFISLRTQTGWKVASLHLTGAWTWIIWGIEAVTLVGGGVLGGWAQGAEPYCETCRGWAVEGEPIVRRQTPSLIETLTHTRDLDVLLAPACPTRRTPRSV